MQKVFSTELLKWYDVHKRNLPWRTTKDPYKIWLSEIILQQTRVEQGWNYYLAFVDSYPTVQDLAKASEQEVLKLWQGLGYYSRARNLHFTAQYITEDLQGIFPKTYADLLQLKGVGKYTAAAIASFAYGEAVPAIDGNVYRVLARVFGVNETINTPKAEKVFRALAIEVLPHKAAGNFNQAMMELGAMVCKPKNPDCINCPIVAKCWAKAEGKQLELPVKKRAMKVRKRYFHYFIIAHNEQIVLQERKEKDVWQHLFQFPLLEQKSPNLSEIATFLEKYLGVKSKVLLHKNNETPIVHKLSHQHLYITFWTVESDDSKPEKPYFSVSKVDLRDYPFPIVLAKQVELLVGENK